MGIPVPNWHALLGRHQLGATCPTVRHNDTNNVDNIDSKAYLKIPLSVITSRPERMMLLAEYKRRRVEALKKDQRRQTEVRDMVQLFD